MAPPVRSVRIAAAPLRIAVLAALAIGHLPLPVVHSHATTAASAGLSRHLALFHGSRGVRHASRPHVHVVPPMFLAGGGFTDATGDETPAPVSRDTVPVSYAQLDAPDVMVSADAPCPDSEPVAGSGAAGLTGFYATYAPDYDCGGLLGACRL